MTSSSAHKPAVLRFPEIDALRGVAVIMVLLFHYTTEFGWASAPFNARYHLDLGYLGVHLFFIISGFVIHLTVQRSSSIWSFLRRRLLRLFPAFWICLALSFLLQRWGATLVDRTPPMWIEGITGLTMLNTLFGIPDVDGVYWSLRVEWTFYALIAGVLLTPTRRYAFAATAVWFLASMVHHVFGPFYTIGQILCLPYVGFFLAGICFHRLSVKKGEALWEHLVIALTLVLNLYAFAHDVPRVVVIILFYAVFWIYTFIGLGFLRWKPLVLLGFISYPLYLLHRGIGRVLIAWLHQHGLPTPFAMGLTTLMMIALAWGVARYAEPYVKRTLDRLLPKALAERGGQFSS